MLKNNCHYFLLFLLNLLMFSPATYAATGSTIEKKTESDKTFAPLDLALKIINSDKEEAKVLAKNTLQTAKTTANKKLEMRSYHVLGRIYTEIDLELSLAYYDSAFQIAEEINDNWNKGETLFRMGVSNHRLGKSFLALEAFNAAIQAGRLSENFKAIGSSYSMMGTIFRMNGFYDRAIEYIIKSKLNYEKSGFTEGGAWAAYLLGRIYADLKLPEKALEYFQQGLDEYTRNAGIDGIQTGMAICYEQIGNINIESGNYEEARMNFDKAMKIYSADKSKYGISNIYKNLGRIEYYEGNYILAEKKLNEALTLKNEVGDLLSFASIHEYLGLSQIKRGQIKDGFKNMQQGLDWAEKNNQKKIQLDIYKKLTEAYLSINDHENVIASLKKQIEIQNLILSGDANIKTEQLQAIFEIDEQNRQIELLKTQNKINILLLKQQELIRNIMIVGMLIVLLISITIYWFYSQIRRKNRELEEINVTKDKFFAIIAHDLRGPTGSLASILEHINLSFDDLDKKELKELLSVLYNSAENVSSLLENLLVWAQSQINKIEYRPKELELAACLKNAMDGIKQSAENKEIDIVLEGNNKISVLADPNMLQTIVRNILSNAIKFSHRGGLVIVKSVLNDNNTALVKIIDNGVGIEKSNLTKILELNNKHHTKGTENEKSTGLGLILVQDFVEKNKGTLDLESEKDKGTVVSFTLPIA